MKPAAKAFALCVDNTGYEASLIPGKVYSIIPSPATAGDELIRIMDESGVDYLYHRDHFVFVDFPAEIEKRIRALQKAA